MQNEDKAASESKGPERPAGQKAWLIDYVPALPDVAPGATIIPGDNFKDLQELERAQAELALQLKTVKREIEMVRARARADGFHQGLSEGLARFSAAAQKHEAQIRRFYAGSETTVLRLCHEIVGKIIGLEDKTDLARRLVAEALSAHAAEGTLAIAVASDLASLKDRLPLDNDGTLSGVELRIDPRLSPGRIVLFTRFSAIDVDAEAKLESMISGLKWGEDGEAPSSEEGDAPPGRPMEA